MNELSQLTVAMSADDAKCLDALLTEKPELSQLLLEAAIELSVAFGEYARIRVEIDHPYASQSPTRLVVVAATTLPFKEADTILDRVIDDWWTANHTRGEGRVSLATDLVAELHVGE